MFFVTLTLLSNFALTAAADYDCQDCAEKLVENNGCGIFADSAVTGDPGRYVPLECTHRNDCPVNYYEACKASCGEVSISGCDYDSCCVDQPLALCITKECSYVYGYCCEIQDAPEKDLNSVFQLNPSVVPTVDPSSRSHFSDCEDCAAQFVEKGGCEVFSDSKKMLDPNSYVSAACHDRTDCSDLIYSKCEASCKTVSLAGCDYQACCGESPYALCFTEECLHVYGYCCQIEVVIEDRNVMILLEPAVIPTADPSGGSHGTKYNQNEYVSPCTACDSEFLNNGGCVIYGRNRDLLVNYDELISPQCVSLTECSIPGHSICEKYCTDVYLPGCDYDTCCTDNTSPLCHTKECSEVFGYCCDILSSGRPYSVSR